MPAVLYVQQASLQRDGSKLKGNAMTLFYRALGPLASGQAVSVILSFPLNSFVLYQPPSKL